LFAYVLAYVIVVNLCDVEDWEIMVWLYIGTLACEHNSFQKRTRNPKNSYIKANFPIRNNGNSDDLKNIHIKMINIKYMYTVYIFII
jgi:hypothetical protein